MVWNESNGGRGGSKMASCLFSWTNEELKESYTERLTVSTDINIKSCTET